VGVIFILSLWYCVYVEGHRHGAFPPATERMVYIPLAISGMFLMCKFFDHAPSWILRAFTFVGGISLEIYLIHIQFVLKYIKSYHLGYWPTFLLMLAISLPLAWLLSKLVSFLIKPLPKNI
jgi:peptidoglycan/LPS O-acetylase OafA/YrhL